MWIYCEDPAYSASILLTRSVVFKAKFDRTQSDKPAACGEIVFIGDLCEHSWFRVSPTLYILPLRVTRRLSARHPGVRLRVSSPSAPSPKIE